MSVNRVTKVKICGNTNIKDAISVAEAGADAIGVIYVANTKRYIDLGVAKRIFDAVPVFVSKVVVLRLDNAPIESIQDEINMIADTGADCIQLHGDEPVELIADLRAFLNSNLNLNARVKLIKKVGVGGTKEKCLENALAYESVVDALLLDTVTVGAIGGTGKEHDWNISKEIVEKVKKPVILAGGLNPDNVANAIALVKPYAVDVSSGVEREVRIKDEVKVKRFIEAAKSA
ncbi:phosphoribosylanthranilate isomerase [Methanophagales archaeon]|jgi:phosphoribosylanthranilate isomerase|nr:phosphoribosylanthranilate isomerase [Methanophagales archaeon]